MTGYVTCKHCKGVGKTFRWLIFPEYCPYCNGMGYIWMNSTQAIDEYYKNKNSKEKENMVMKSYTDLEQSKKLAEILPIKSADMYYSKHSLENYYIPTPNIGKYSVIHDQKPCWSVAALLEVIRNNGRYELQMYEGGYYFEANGFMTESYFNAIDACVEMIIHLHELKLL